jgi:hypothetical protein
MADVFVPSANDTAVYTSDKFGLLKDGYGNTYRTVVKANVNGNYDAYSKGTGAFGGDELLYQYNVSTNKVDFNDGKFKDLPTAAYNAFFKSGNAAGFNDTVKKTWFGEAPPNSAERMATLDGYKSIAATVPIRQAQTNVPGGSLTIQTASGPVTTSVPTDSSNPQASFESSVAGGNALTKDENFLQAIADKDVRDKYGDYSYPKPFPEKQDRVKFTMFRYSPKDLKVENFKTGDVFGSRAQPKNNFGTVQLPITPQIQDTNTVSWGNDDMNAFAAMAASASYNIIKDPNAVGQTISAVAKLLQSEGGNASLKSAAGAYLAGEAAGGNKSFLTRVTGALINPNTELLFNAPTLRTFGFSFTMSAREPDEAKEIKKIIRFFKQGMSVKRASTGLFLKTPNIFDIKYILGDTNKDHPWINQIKTCALTSCSVNYTPAGNYATFYDGAMSAYEMTLSFTELDPVFEDDYVSDNDATIGY